ESYSTIVNVASSGWTKKHPKIKRKVQVRFRRPSWSEYSVAANDVMRFGEGTNVHGPIHSNNGIRFDGVANNKVTSSVEEYYDPDTYSYKPGVWTSQSNEDEVFLAGKEYPVPILDFNSVISDLNLIKDEAQAGGLFFGEEVYETEECEQARLGPPPPIWGVECNMVEKEVEGYHFTLRADDKVEVQRVFEYSGDNWREGDSYRIREESDPEVFDLPENGLIYANNNVWVEGQIDTARITITAARLNSNFDPDIYINNDVLYTNKNGDDIIGLIAENDISVGLFSEDDLKIDGALLAQKGRVGRDYYNYFQGGSYVTRDEITLYGSIATNERYGFAWIDGTGYQTRNIYFDSNLKYYPPPYFPTGNAYSLDLWQDVK
ncbi:MAG: hypothetical protein R6V40_04080, partial [Candidatus Moraniibacteriota bacterium]